MARVTTHARYGISLTAMEVPEALKAAVPQTAWGRILTATPIVMTIVATALAGLSSSEMTRAQYRRSLAAQQQAKAGDQWSLFQAKRLRGSSQRATLDIIETTSDARPLDVPALKKAEPGLESPVGQQMLAILEGGPLPTLPPGPALDGNVKAALEALESAKSEPEIAARLTHVTDDALDAALGATRDRAQALDVALGPINRSLEELETGLVRRA